MRAVSNMLYQFTEKDYALEKAFLDNPFEAVNTWAYKEKLADVTAEWLMGRENWCTFITFTFKDEISKDLAYRKIKRFIREANELEFGSHYTQKVGHSYFSYVIGMERQERGVIHFHMCIDRKIDFNWIHCYWNKFNGLVWIILFYPYQQRQYLLEQLLGIGFVSIAKSIGMFSFAIFLQLSQT
jgi:hypothetical protein